MFGQSGKYASGQRRLAVNQSSQTSGVRIPPCPLLVRHHKAMKERGADKRKVERLTGTIIRLHIDPATSNLCGCGETVNTLARGASGRKLLEVRLLSSALLVSYGEPIMKKVWCKTTITGLGYLGCRIRPNKYKQTPKTRRKRWKCPNCKRRFKICSRRTEGGEVVFWAPAHKKTQRKESK